MGVDIDVPHNVHLHEILWENIQIHPHLVLYY